MAQKHTINDIEKPMTTYGPEQGPNKRYRRLRHPAFPAATWTDKNPLLQKGEIGAETDTHKAKVGDGVTYWNDLPYITAVGQPLSTADYQMGNAQGEWTTMSQAQQDALNSGATSAKINSIAGKLNLDGTNTMTGVLKMRASISFQCAIAPYWDGVGFYKLNDNDSVTLMASMESTQGFSPFGTNTYDIGTSSHKWKNLYLAGKAYVSTINNGFDIAVPVTNSADTFALKSQVDLKANSADLGTAAYTASTDYATAAQGALADTAVQPGDLATVATTGDYDDLLNKPTIPAAQVNSDWNANSGVAEILNKPTTLSGYGITDGANTDLSNLTNTGKNIGLWCNNAANIITEIPQDIKLELDTATHTITLKAESKVYIPNGFEADGTTPHFDIITITTDLQQTPVGTYSGGSVLYVKSDGSEIQQSINNVSGTTAPTDGAWYDTNTNLIKYYSGGSDTGTRLSLPIATATRTSGNWTSIDQVFNGFGYIGSTVFALPGVKGLIPNGRNADGTPKSTEFSLTSVITKDITLAGTYRGVGIWLTATSISPVILGNVEGTGVWAYHEDINFNKSETGIEQVCLAGIFDLSSNVISNFKPKTAFHALDWSDSNIVSGWAMPSNKRLALTLGASGTSYAAPADGWFVVSKASGTSGAFFNLTNETAGLGFTSDGYQTGNKYITIPVSKGDVVKCSYSFSGTTVFFRFIYANGAK